MPTHKKMSAAARQTAKAPRVPATATRTARAPRVPAAATRTARAPRVDAWVLEILASILNRRGAAHLVDSFVPLHLRTLAAGPADPAQDNVAAAIARCGADDWFALGRLRELRAATPRDDVFRGRMLNAAIEAAEASPIMSWWCRDTAEFPELAALVGLLHEGALPSPTTAAATTAALAEEVAACTGMSPHSANPRLRALCLAMYLMRVAAGGV